MKNYYGTGADAEPMLLWFDWEIQNELKIARNLLPCKSILLLLIFFWCVLHVLVTVSVPSFYDTAAKCGNPPYLHISAMIAEGRLGVRI